MASSGSITTGTKEGRSVTLSWTLSSQDISNNTSTIAWTLKGSGSGSGWVMSGGFKAVINGTTVYSTSTDNRIQLYNGTVVASGSLKISHNADGTKSFKLSCEAGVYSYAVNVSASGTHTLNTIPRASSVSATSVNMGSQKAAIARALLLEPELLICDEAVSSLDAATRTQILDLLLRVVKEKKIACLFISHDMALIRRISHRTGVLYKGTLAECAKTRDLCRDPWHPYTKALLDSVMPPDPLKARKQKVPAVHEGKSEGGCPYFGSCGYKMEMCKDAAPEMYDFEGRAVSCHLYSKQQRAGRNPNYKMTSQI